MVRFDCLLKSIKLYRNSERRNVVSHRRDKDILFYDFLTLKKPFCTYKPTELSLRASASRSPRKTSTSLNHPKKANSQPTAAPYQFPKPFDTHPQAKPIPRIA